VVKPVPHPQDYNIVVRNAVPAAVNGTYTFQKWFNEAGRYRRIGPYAGNIDTEFFITRWTDGHMFEWSIAHFLESEQCCVDHFRVKGVRDKFIPLDKAQWKCVHQNCTLSCVVPNVSVVLIAR
jgi:uncharacterized NAD(P)/FAD-binding protein YdhS